MLQDAPSPAVLAEGTMSENGPGRTPCSTMPPPVHLRTDGKEGNPFPNCREGLRIAEGDCLPGPSIGSQHGALRVLEQCLVKRHLLGPAAVSFVEKRSITSKSGIAKSQRPAFI